MTARNYPIPNPDPEAEDRRFTLGLVMDVAEVLEDHGFPPMGDAVDLVGLQLALHRFLYASYASTASEATS